ncbi:MAG: AAA family ATPase [Desulfurococcus sp.]|uniref:RAD55 family ATPase n=1 Tax=Desulfurococcus sp. TaxID=51678 RepID=UPI00315F8655
MIFIEFYTGNRDIDELIRNATTILFYGVAGSGKTSMLITIAGNYCRGVKCLYISTEETLHYEKVAVNPDKYRDVLFTEVYDFNKLVELATLIYLYGSSVVFVDSLNSLFRLESLAENSISRLAYVVASIRGVVEDMGGKMFASAQVRAREGESEPVGKPVLEYYFDLIIELNIGDSVRYARIVKPKHMGREKIHRFRITREGVEWI